MKVVETPLRGSPRESRPTRGLKRQGFVVLEKLIMTITIVEDFGRGFTVEKYTKKTDKRAFKSGNNIIYFTDSQGVGRYENNGRNAGWLAKTCELLEKNGFLLSENLKEHYEEEVFNAKVRAQEIEQNITDKKAKAKATSNPVVISSAHYQTTASAGRNFWVAMPDGSTIDVAVGNSSASHSTQLVTNNNNAAIQAAIAEYLESL